MPARRAAWIALTAAAVVAIIGGAMNRHVRGPGDGRVRVYDARTGRHLWSRGTGGGYVVVLAVTPEAALVADADDCIHGVQGNIEILSRSRTTFVSYADPCQIYRVDHYDGVSARVSSRSPRQLAVQVPPQLGGGLVRLPCPCPAIGPNPGGSAGSPATFGATVKVSLGSFVPGAD